jgi:hypothetical protein
LDIFNVLSIGANIGNEIESGTKNMLTAQDKIQIAVADVLTQFMFCKNEQDFHDVHLHELKNNMDLNKTHLQVVHVVK